jgi:hypothetical protein
MGMHLLTWVGFGLLGYVPNTLYMHAPDPYLQSQSIIYYKLNGMITMATYFDIFAKNVIPKRR